MSYYNDFLKELKKRELTIDDITVGRNADSKSSDGRTVSIGNSSFANEFKSELAKRGLTISDVMEKEEEIAPIRTRVSSKDDDDIAPVRKDKEEEEERTWFQRGAFEDGFSLKNLGKAILGSAEDVIENVGTGIVGMGEKLVDSFVHLAPYYSQSQFYQNGGSFLSEDMQEKQNQAFEVGKKSAAEFIQKDLYDEEKVVKQIYSNNTISKRLLNADPDDLSVFGEKSDALAQSAGQLAATAALSSAGVPWFLTTGVTSYGGEVENALKQGATMEEAGVSGLITAGAEILTEKISGGIKFGGKTLDEGLTKIIARNITDKTARTLMKLGLDATGEGFEEVLSGAISAVGQRIAYDDNKDISFDELFFSEEAFESFIGGAVLGGGSSVIGAVKSAKNGIDSVTELTKNEQKVVDKEYKDRVAEAEKNGKVSQSEKSKIYDQVLKDMEKGYISTDSIEAALGGETYNTYRSTAASESNILKEFEELGKKQNPTLSETHRYNELVEQVKEIKEKKAGEQLKGKLGEEVKSLVAGDRLAESYNERSRRQQAFEADLSQYDEKQQAVIKKAVESGILNNTNRTHEFVDMVAKISADKGVLFDFTNNAKLKESGFSLDGASVNGYKTGDGIVVNVDSAKSRSFVVGHEVTHVLEGTELYGELQKAVFDYAKMKGEYDSRLASVTELYKKYDPEADPAKELTSDLVGEYLFSDPEFVNNLSTEHRNVFQKVYDEIKYMLKVATAGSKEARELEKVKKIFEQAYRAETKNTAESGAQYNIERTKTMSWADQIQGALYNGKNIRRNDTLVVGNPSDTPVANEIDNKPLAIPLSVMTKASSGKDISHSIKKGKLAKLDAGIKNAPITIVNPERNAVVYVTDIKQGGLPVIAAFEMNSTFDGDEVHKATSIHLQVDTEAMLKNLPETATVYVRKNELDPVGATNNLRGLAAKIKFIEGTVAQDSRNVNEKFSLAEEVTEEQNQRGLEAKSEVQYSLSHDTDYMDKAISLNNSTHHVTSDNMLSVKAMRERIAARMIDIKDRGLVGLPEDIEGNTYIANSSYDGTEENTTICPRSLASEAFTDAVSEYLGRPLTVEEQIYISQDLQGRSLTPECTYCYVATDRKAYRAFLGEYINQRDAVIQKVKENPSADTSRNGELYKEFLNGRKDTKPMYSRFKMWVDAYTNGKPMIEASNLANISKLMGDINSEFGAELKPQIVDAMKYAQSASWAKKRVNYVAYNGHILKWKQDRINKLNSHYGLRMYSFSDFHPAFVLENMQMITDASVRGLKMLGYTKDTDFVEIFAPSGMNINVSTFGFETNGNVYENNIIGAEWEKARKLREQYPNVGITFVATNDHLVNWAMDQDWIDVVIPYHLVRTGAEVAKAFGYTNYTSESSDTKDVGWTKGKDKNYIAPTDHNNDKATYLAALQKNRLKPRFERFIDNPNYMKLVNESRQPASESKPVQPVFNEDAAMVTLAKLEANGFYQPIGGSVERMYEIAAEVAEDMTKQLAPDAQHSLSEEGSQQRPVFDPLTDLRLEGREDIAPVVENATTEAPVSNTESVEELFPDDTAPIQEEYENLLAEREDIKGAMDAYAAVGNYDGAEQLMAEYEAVQARIAEIEADDADRFASIDDADAPQEVENSNPEDVADNVPLTKVLVNNLAKQVKSQLGLGNNRTAEVRELIERYSNEEFPSKAHLYTEIAERFGTITETEVDEDLKGIKSLLRTYGINVDDSIKAEIPDYAQLMRSNFGKVRFSKEGLPVDVAYKEFQEALPGYFPESIYVPTDQLMRIIEVANMDTTMETEYEIDWQTLEEVTDTIMNGVAEFKQNRKETLANKHGRESFRSLMEDADQYVPPIPENVAPASYSIAEDTAPVRPAIESVQAEPDDIAPVFETSSGQQAILPEVEVPKKLTRKDLHFNIMNQIKTYFRNKGSDFDKVLKDAKDLSTFATVDNTPQRVLEKALGYKEGQMLSEMTVNRVARNETEGIKWLNSFTDKKSGLLVKISKQYGIKPGSKASAAAQMYAEGFYVGENDAIIAYGDRELAADFPDKKVQDNIKKLAKDPRIRQIYDETLAAINKSRTRNAYPEIPRLDNYFLHFRAMEDTFSRMGLPFNPNDIRAKDLPTDLNGVTADLKPGQPYFASAMHRTGKRTSFDMLGGLEKYLTSAKNQIYHIDDIQTFRALRNYVAETYGQANGLKDLDLLSDEEAEQRIKDVYDSHLSTFAKFLNEEANVLAGKTSLIDRGLEGVIGRRGITFLDTLNKQVGSNMVGFNVSSSLTNFLAPVQAFAKTNKFDFVKAMAQTAHNKLASVVGKGDSFAEESPVMIRRKGAERFYRTPYQKVADAGYVLMGVVDDISTELIARTKYNEFTRKGMSSNQAHYETDKWVSRLMGDRSLGQQPQLYNSKMLGLFTKFQLEVRNQLDSQFYDTIQEAKVSTEEIENKLLRNAKKAAKITSTFAQLAVMQHLFGKAFESVAGYNPAFDIIEALVKAFGWDDEEEDEDTVLDNIEEGFLSLLGDLPYTSTLTGGRIPIASALPVTQFIKGEDQYGNEKNRWQTLGEAAPYYVLPGGYGQIKKTKAGLEMFDEDLPIAGSYTDSGGLRFPVEDTIGNRVQAGLFGQWASENARDYFDNERKPLKEKQIQELIDTEMPIKDYWDYREGLAEHEKLEDKIDYIAGLDLPISTKNILVNNVTDRKNPIDLTNYDEFATYEEFDFASKNPEKYEFLEANNISYAAYTFSDGAKETYDAVYEWVNNYPDKVTVSKAVTDNVVTYRRYAKDLDAIRADKTSSGKTINGSAKEKKWNYIDSLDIDYGAKLILFKNEYNADDTYNYEIIDYLNGREDISFDEMNTILKELGFNVTADGTITW